MATDKESKTEQPTSRRLQDAKKKGDLPRSKDLVASVSLLFTILFFALFMPYLAKISTGFTVKYLGRVGELELTDATVHLFGKDFFMTYLKLLLPIFVLLIAVALFMEIAQGGQIRWVPDNLKIKWEKVFFLSQIPQGLKKILGSVEALFELGKSLVKVACIGLIAYWVISAEVPVLFDLPKKTLIEILQFMGSIFLKLAFYITIFLLVISVADYLFQRYRYTEKLKMSKHDVKDEFKQTEGDPQIKGKQKQIQFQWAMQRMMAEVPEADVVITNPTHYAVALKYEYKKMESPQLLAKGKDLMAERIKEVARENNIPIVENPPVARSVYANVEILQYIPGDLFKPVAEILAYIYKLKGKKFN